MAEKTIEGQLPQSCCTLDQDQKFYDVILQINDIQLYCHRFILASHSPFFEAMLTNDMMESKQKLIQLKEIDSQATTDIIRFMYGQQLKITIQNAQLLAITASRLLVMPIVDACCEKLSKNIDLENIFQIYLFAETYQFQQIIDASYRFMINNFKNCSMNGDFHKIPSSMLIRCLQSNELRVSKEVDLLYMVERWYNDHIPQCDDDTLTKIFSNIRLPIISMNDLIEFEQNTKLFDASKPCLDLLNKVKFFYETPERHFSKLCQLNYRYQTDDFKYIVKDSKIETNKEMPRIAIRDTYLDYGDTFMNVEAVNRLSYGAVAIGHKLFLMGGTTADKTEILNSIIAFDTRKSRWMHPKIPPLPNPAAGLSVCLDDNRLYIIGGYNSNEEIASKEVAYLQSGTDHWVRVSPMNIARKFSVACALDHFIYVMGGDYGHSKERYNPTTDTWELLSSDTVIKVKSRYGRLTAFEGHLYYLAHETVQRGRSSANYYNTCEQCDIFQNQKSVGSNKGGPNRYDVQRTLRFIDKTN